MNHFKEQISRRVRTETSEQYLEATGHFNQVKGNMLTVLACLFVSSPAVCILTGGKPGISAVIAPRSPSACLPPLLTPE